MYTHANSPTHVKWNHKRSVSDRYDILDFCIYIYLFSSFVFTVHTKCVCLSFNCGPHSKWNCLTKNWNCIWKCICMRSTILYTVHCIAIFDIPCHARVRLQVVCFFFWKEQIIIWERLQYYWKFVWKFFSMFFVHIISLLTVIELWSVLCPSFTGFVCFK